VVIGNTGGFIDGKYDQNMYIMKLDGNGNKIDERIYGEQEVINITSVKNTSDFGYIVAGSIRSDALKKEDFYIIKFDRSFNKVWAKKYGDEILMNTLTLSPQLLMEGISSLENLRIMI